MLKGPSGIAKGTAKRSVLIAGDSANTVAAIHGLIRDSRELAVETRVIDAREPDPLYGVPQMPDLLLLRIGTGSVRELEALAGYTPDERPALIVIGDVNHPGSMRAAMQAGARDFLAEPLAGDDLLEAIGRLASERRASGSSDQCQLTAVVNGKGGSGATFLACNIAHLLAEVSKLDTALLGLDTQFGSLPRYLDIKPKRGLLEALDVVEDLDGAAIEAYLARHDSGLALLACLHDGALLQQEMLTDRFGLLLELLLSNFDRCVVDLPHGLEPFSAHVLEHADQIVLVAQQSVPHLHDTARMYDLMTRNLGVPAERITIVVNRFNRAAAVELADIQRYFGERPVVCVPNDYRSVAESINVGEPIYRYAKRSPVTKSLIQLQEQLGGRAASTDKGFFPKLRLTG